MGDNSDARSLGTRIKKTRERKGIEQRTVAQRVIDLVADALGVHPSAIAGDPPSYYSGQLDVIEAKLDRLLACAQAVAATTVDDAMREAVQRVLSAGSALEPQRAAGT